MSEKVKKQPRIAFLSFSHFNAPDRRRARAKAKKVAKNRSKLPGSFSLSKQAFVNMGRFWRPLGGIFLCYLLLNILLVGGFGSLSSNVSSLRDELNVSTHGASDKLGTAANGFVNLLATGSASSDTGKTAQSFLLILGSLVVIWALRRLLANEQFTVKQAFYSSTTPLVPFILVLLVILLQLLPFIVGSVVFATVLANNLALSNLIISLFGLLFVLLSTWSVYMVSSSVFALYIVTLPDMQPIKALRTASNLVRFRRWRLLRNLFFLPLVIFIIFGGIIIGLILLAPALVAPVFYVLSLWCLFFAHTYLYSLYRYLL